ncbi:MAG: hypothetical protein A2X94_02775 [Bdellovibrionales bacterium GWB1_55_8]|nr:MAG: hypothetical protein A2X94_02775 [Bdellovibrionales bacterium GWB1_55_8]
MARLALEPLFLMHIREHLQEVIARKLRTSLVADVVFARSPPVILATDEVIPMAAQAGYVPWFGRRWGLRWLLRRVETAVGRFPVTTFATLDVAGGTILFRELPRLSGTLVPAVKRALDESRFTAVSAQAVARKIAVFRVAPFTP